MIGQLEFCHPEHFLIAVIYIGVLGRSFMISLLKHKVIMTLSLVASKKNASSTPNLDIQT